MSYGDDPRLVNWNDGMPTAIRADDPSGSFIFGTGNGFTFTAPADTAQRTLIVHVGGWQSGGRLTAHLSDNSAVDYTNTSATVNDQYDRDYTLTYRAGGPGQTLRVTWTMASGATSDGNVTISAAAFSVASTGSVVATAGTPQSTVVNTAFGTALQATVRDAGNNPVAGVTVTFTAPGAGRAPGLAARRRQPPRPTAAAWRRRPR